MTSTHHPPPPLDGDIRLDEHSRGAAADDFGHFVHRTPEGVLLPASDEDVAATIRWAAERGRRFTPQGRRQVGPDSAAGTIVNSVGFMRLRAKRWHIMLGNHATLAVALHLGQCRALLETQPATGRRPCGY
ncbi:MAG: hypothetical protein ACRDSI_10090 [Pseudonocardiaceae bacterium]